MRAAGCVTLFWLVGSEVTGRCFRNLDVSLKLTILHLGGGALVPAVKSKVLSYMYPLRRNQDPAPRLHYCLFNIFFFLMWTIFKVFIVFVTILLLLYVLVFLPPGMWDLSTPTRDQTWTPCIGSWSPNHWTTRHYCFLTIAPGLTSPPFSDQQLFESALCNSVEVKEAEWSLLNTGKFCTWDSHIRSCFVPFLSLKNQNFFFF